MRSWYLGWLILLVITVSGCVWSKPKHAIQHGTPAPEWARRWLQEVPCAPPCWEGIVPGQTTKTLAILRLRNLSQATNIDIFEPLYDEPSLHWSWKDGGGGTIEFSHNVVKSISVSFPGAFQFSDIISMYGLPSHFQTSIMQLEAEPPSYGITVFYPAKGFYLHTATEGAQPLVNQQFWFDHGVTFIPTTNQELHTARTHPWTTFSAIEQSYRNDPPIGP